MTTLQSWEYADPAKVAERRQLQAKAKAKRKRPEERGLTPITIRNMRRLRIQELVREVLRGKR